MKKQLRNMMLAGVATMLAGNAWAADSAAGSIDSIAAGFNLTIDWEQALPTLATGGGVSDWKDATAVKGSNEILVMNKTTKSIWSFTDTVAKEVVTNLPTTPFAITCDEAGNVIFNNGGGAATGATNFYILPAGKRTAGDIQALTLTLPEGLEAARVDYLGRVLGDVLSEEGGWFNTAMNTSKAVTSYHIAEGELIESYASLELPAALTTMYVTQPWGTSLEECLDASDPSMTAYVYGGNVSTILQPNEDFDDWAKINRVQQRSAAGFDWFMLGDEIYFVYGAKLAGRADTWCPNDFVIVRASDSVVVAAYKAPADTPSGAVCGGITAYANEDGKSATIYRFTSISGAAKFTFSLEDETPVTPSVPALYILGQNGTAWDPATPDTFTYNDSTKTYSYNLVGAANGFKISTAKGDWTAFDAAGFHVDGVLAANTVTTLIAGVPANGANITLSPVFDCTIVVDLENMTIEAQGSTSVAAPEKLFVLGNLSIGSWDPTKGVELTKNGSIFEGDVAMEGGYFSFTEALSTDGDWSKLGQRYGATTRDQETHLNTALTFQKGENAFNIVDYTEYPQTVHFVVNFDEMTVTISTATGVEDVAIDAAAPAEYYNLQGIRVAQPEAGKLYIVKKGDKVSKTLVK